MSRYQKGNTIWILPKKATVSGSGISCTLLQTDNHASSPPLSFLQAGCPSCRPTNSVKAEQNRADTCTAVTITWRRYLEVDGHALGDAYGRVGGVVADPARVLVDGLRDADGHVHVGTERWRSGVARHYQQLHALLLHHPASQSQ